LVYLKRILSLTVIFLISLFITELLIRITINHPTYNIEKKLTGLRKSSGGITDIYYPYSRFWTSEGGYSISTTNNLGLAGSDVAVTDTSKYIYVLGSSYIQANQVERKNVSTSVFQSLIGFNSKYQVINLGEGGLDQYDSYFKIKYYEKLYNPYLIIMVVDRVDDRWLSRHDSLTFNADIFNVREIKDNATGKIEILFRRNSAFINLLSNGYKISSKLGSEDNKKRTAINDPNNTKVENISKHFFPCIEKFASDYGNKFVLVSMIDNIEINNYINKFCKDKNIIYRFRNINRMENRLSRTGHLNENGNKELGELLYNIFEEIKYKND
jgi:hypothetical protein